MLPVTCLVHTASKSLLVVLIYEIGVFMLIGTHTVYLLCAFAVIAGLGLLLRFCFTVAQLVLLA